MQDPKSIFISVPSPEYASSFIKQRILTDSLIDITEIQGREGNDITTVFLTSAIPLNIPHFQYFEQEATLVIMAQPRIKHLPVGGFV